MERTAAGEERDITEELPFDIPDSWEWVRLGRIADTVLGKMLDRQKNKGVPHPYLRNVNVRWGEFDLSNILEMRFEDDEIDRYSVTFGDLVIVEGGEPGRCAVWRNSEETALIQKALHRSRFYSGISAEYAHYVMNYYAKSGLLNAHFTGTTIKHLPGQILVTIPIPLPPIAEQRRIVERIEELLPRIADYEIAEQNLTALNTAFPEQLKKSILQAAVQGKLVPQDPADEPASVLLERIRAEKAALIKVGKVKKGKHESVIFRRDNSHYEKLDGIERCIDDEIPFDVPESWAWARLADVVYNHGQMAPQNNFCYIDIGSIDNKRQQLNGQDTVVSAAKAPSRARKIVEQGDILYSTVRPYLHNMCIVNREFSYTPIASTGFAVMACYDGILNIYLFNYLLSPDFNNYANDTENAKGVAYPAINDTKLYNALVPVPPLVEQYRIVERIGCILPICENL